jgi:putative membrane protein
MKLNSRMATSLATVGMLTLFSGAAIAKMGSALAPDTFIQKAAEGGMAEVELGNLAAQKASSPAVKKFGQRMVTDHTRINDQLKPIASKQGVTLPSTLDAKDQELKDRLDKLSGHDFDRTYMEAMVKDHYADVSEFRKEAHHGHNPDVKSFAASALPTLQAHLQLAEDTLHEVKTGNQGAAARQK